MLLLHLIREDLLLEFSKPLNLRVQLRESHLKPRPATAEFSSVLQPSPLTDTTAAPHKDRKGHESWDFIQTDFTQRQFSRSNHGRVFRKPVHGTDPKLNNHTGSLSVFQIDTLAQTLTQIGKFQEYLQSSGAVNTNKYNGKN